MFQGVARVAAVSLSIGYPTVASAPHSIINGFKNLLAVAAATDVEFKQAETVKEYLKVYLLLFFSQCMIYENAYLLRACSPK